MKINIDIPDYTTLCRRLKNIGTKIQNNLSSQKHLHILIDSTGLKVYGEGEWKVRQHGHSKSKDLEKLKSSHR